MGRHASRPLQRVRFFGGEGEESGEKTLSIGRWAETGIAGRGIPLDVVEHRLRAGRPLDPFTGETISAGGLAEAAGRQGIEIRVGDILCVRTGWIEAFRGLERTKREEMARFLWDNHVAAVACDNPAVEAAPGDPAAGFLHRRVLPLLGLALAELLTLGRLSGPCKEAKRWEFFFTAAPLNVPGGVGSPANALAVL